MSWNDEDFNSPDPFVRFNAHQAAKGRAGLPDVDAVRKQQRENPSADLPQGKSAYQCSPDVSVGVGR